jgi:hypothetical protein
MSVLINSIIIINVQEKVKEMLLPKRERLLCWQNPLLNGYINQYNLTVS